MTLAPVPLEINTPQRFYHGGRTILAFRRRPVPTDFDDRRPEDWIASTARLFAEGGGGLTVLTDGSTLVDALERDAESWLGRDHLDRHGAEPGLLVKLLDVAERLPVHSHPDRAFAARHLDCAHGKTEAWLVLDAAPGSLVWLGFRDDVTDARLAEMVDAQDEQLVEALNPFAVERGDVVLVPAGQPHAIGAGVFAVELQEPTDFSVMLEHDRFGLDPYQSWLGLERSLALRSVARDRLSPDALASVRRRWDRFPGPVSSALPAEADEFFRADVLCGDPGPAVTEAGFSVLVVVEGVGRLATEHAGELDVRSGDIVLTPYSCGALTLTGPVTAFRCRPGRDTQQTSGATAPASTIQHLEE